MKTFLILMKKVKMELDQIRKAMNELLDQKDSLNAEIQKIYQNLEDEKAFITKTQTLIPLKFDLFIQSCFLKIKTAEESISELDVKITELQDELFDLYQDYQKYKILSERALEKAALDLKLKEDKIQDELTITRFGR